MQIKGDYDIIFKLSLKAVNKYTHSAVFGWVSPRYKVISVIRGGMEVKPQEEKIMAVVSMKQLLEAGVHFGHQTRRWNPKMAEYIFTERNGIYIIDLQKTVKKLNEAYLFACEIAKNGGDILFVGTKK